MNRYETDVEGRCCYFDYFIYFWSLKLYRPTNFSHTSKKFYFAQFLSFCAQFVPSFLLYIHDFCLVYITALGSLLAFVKDRSLTVVTIDRWV